MEYISNYKPTSFAFCFIKENPLIYVSSMDMEIAKYNSSIEIKEYKSFDEIITDLKREGIKKLAIEPTLQYSTYEKFRNDFDISSKTYIDKQRMIKTPDEINKIKKATEIAQKSFLKLNIQNNKCSEKEISFDLDN